MVRQLARVCGADQPLLLPTEVLPKISANSGLSELTDPQQSIGLFPCLVNGLLRAAICSQITTSVFAPLRDDIESWAGAGSWPRRADPAAALCG